MEAIHGSYRQVRENRSKTCSLLPPLAFFFRPAPNSKKSRMLTLFFSLLHRPFPFFSHSSTAFFALPPLLFLSKSIFITGIIIHSAWPLVRSASFVLLQGVPVGVDIEEIRTEIKAIPDVISIHDLHIWQLTNIKMVASLHVLVTNQEAFERVSRTVKTIMHRAGVHSTTIQPEFPRMHPYLSQAIKSKDTLRLRKYLSEDDTKHLLATGSSPSFGGAMAAQSGESLPGGSTSQAMFTLQGPDGAPVAVTATAAAAPETVATDGVGAGGVEQVPGSSLILIPDDEIKDDLDCALLCADGEAACDVGSCCTLPVKR